jgi:hypothetical protein
MINDLLVERFRAAPGLTTELDLVGLALFLTCLGVLLTAFFCDAAFLDFGLAGIIHCGEETRVSTGGGGNFFMSTIGEARDCHVAFFFYLKDDS